MTSEINHAEILEVELIGGVMGFRSLSFVVLFACFVSACAVIDPVDNRYDTVSRSLAKARNESIFLNLVRASHDYPLSFVTIANVTPSMSNTTTLGLPSFLFGPRPFSSTVNRDVTFGNTTASNATLVSTNFSVATQETSAFYQGFLRPIDLTTLAYFIRQGYPREMLFWLFMDSFELTLRGHEFGYRYDPPNDYGCAPGDPKHRCFMDWIRIATAAGLTVEELAQQKGGGGGGGRSGAGKGKAGEETKGEATGGGGGSGAAFARFCFNPVLAQQALAAMTPDERSKIRALSDIPPSAFNPVCGSEWDPLSLADRPQPDILPFHVGPITFKIVPRSAYGVFEFLGTVMKLQRASLESAPYLIPPGRLDVGEAPMLVTVHDDPNLVTVAHNSGGDCFSHTWFYDGDYCVPENAATTKRIFGLLAQLIAIQTAAGDLSITPLVRVIQ